ncbi:AAA family ATPase [Denitratisoma oestradiolicum]|uniref:AAA+ ATPase domain-containing protein n=1 Tax=Denitratisoma oestradiolicum TaxID=311182 RepID=A0A6S6Y0A1_9PROT|nr:AAA family ATPase [Denitratisoma oestradiolicum]TWO80371.1 AAA family ATPase [Denitratisoma oestradiolicum]CAB1370171.1 conserved protein of unknown function [Denitratisoma oestradiolicum]
MDPRHTILELQQRLNREVLGQSALVERLILGLLANGHLLVEGLPGLAKTRAVRSLAGHLAARLSRIQFTPDLLPADITGSEIYHQEGGRDEFRFAPGPVFADLVLADEINRAPAKVQAALLEAMEERQVTVAGSTHILPPLFMVMATQNPIEQEGTYPLPEAQMDRFLMKVKVGYPGVEAEAEMLRLVRGEERPDGTRPMGDDLPPLATEIVFAARRQVHDIHVAPVIDRYLVDLVHATREPRPYGDDLAGWLQVGASPRGAIALDRVARAHAWLMGRDHVTPDDVRAVAADCLRHRLILSYEAHAGGIDADQAIAALLQRVAVA